MRIILVLAVTILSLALSQREVLAQAGKLDLKGKDFFDSVYDTAKPNPFNMPDQARDKLRVPAAYLSITSVTALPNADANDVTSKTGLRITGHYHNYNRKTISSWGLNYSIDVFNGKSWTRLKQGQVTPTLANKSGAIWVDVPRYRFEKRTFRFTIDPSVEGWKELVIPPGETNSGPRGSHGEIPIRPAKKAMR